MDSIINPYLSALAQCAAEEVNANGNTCFSGVTVGDSFISMSGIGDCEDACGEMWVRVATMYPSTSTGVAEVGQVNCHTSLGLDIEIGAIRCFEMHEGGEAPTAAELLAANMQSMDDAAAIYRAIVCCNHFPDVVVGQWTPIGPEGGMVGGIWTLAVGLV